MDLQLSEAVQSALEAQAAAQDVRSTSEPPTDATAGAIIGSKCAGEWPDDFSMRAYCEKQQREGLANLRARGVGSTAMSTIRDKCAGEWSGDFSMRNYCEEQQLNSDFRFGYGTFTHPSSRHALICAGSA